ncbi:MAG: D-alanyl-D-alanine carboxypeptidase [Ferruginibacter sp.]
MKLFALFSLFTLSTLFTLSSCSSTKQISRQADIILLKDSAIRQGHIGICIYEPATGKYWYNYDAEKYFVPASNTKLFTLYAGMKYLGDSLVGLRYQNNNTSEINIFPAADPTFLHPDFKNQPVIDFLKKENRHIYFSELHEYKENPLGFGWSWDDYNDDYMVERSSFPVYGNIIKLNYDSLQYLKNELKIKWNISPHYFIDYIDSINHSSIFYRNVDSADASKSLLKFFVKREISSNKLKLLSSSTSFSSQEIPFFTNDDFTSIDILKKDFSLNIQAGRIINDNAPLQIPAGKIYSIHTQPTDSLFKPMMHRSDNFFAEQTLLMASNEHLGYMSDEDMIDSLLKSDLKDVPQKPKWVDGSGLSRYNLFTPKDFVYILNKIKNDFGFARIKNILPTGGTGTLSSYYKKDSSFIFAKTGTLSNNCALSGYLITKKNKLLIFSVLVNNYQTGATPVRKAVEKFIGFIREKY